MACAFTKLPQCRAKMGILVAKEQAKTKSELLSFVWTQEHDANLWEFFELGSLDKNKKRALFVSKIGVIIHKSSSSRQKTKSRGVVVLEKDRRHYVDRRDLDTCHVVFWSFTFLDQTRSGGE